MKARRLIDGASFGPAAMKAIGEAFDAAWTEIAANFGSAAGRRREGTRAVGSRHTGGCLRG
jgi:hypothetical protein